MPRDSHAHAQDNALYNCCWFVVTSSSSSCRISFDAPRRSSAKPECLGPSSRTPDLARIDWHCLTRITSSVLLTFYGCANGDDGNRGPVICETVLEPPAEEGLQIRGEVGTQV